MNNCDRLFFVVTSKVNDLMTMNTTFPFQAKLQHWNLVQFVGEYALQWEFDPHKNTVTLFSYHSSTKKMVVLRFNRGSILL